MKRKSRNFIAVKNLCIGLSLCCMASGAQAATNSAFEKKFDVQFAVNQVTLKNVVELLQEQTDVVFSYDGVNKSKQRIGKSKKRKY